MGMEGPGPYYYQSIRRQQKRNILAVRKLARGVKVGDKVKFDLWGGKRGKSVRVGTVTKVKTGDLWRFGSVGRRGDAHGFNYPNKPFKVPYFTVAYTGKKGTVAHAQVPGFTLVGKGSRPRTARQRAQSRINGRIRSLGSKH